MRMPMVIPPTAPPEISLATGCCVFSARGGGLGSLDEVADVELVCTKLTVMRGVTIQVTPLPPTTCRTDVVSEVPGNVALEGCDWSCEAVTCSDPPGGALGWTGTPVTAGMESKVGQTVGSALRSLVRVALEVSAPFVRFAFEAL